MDFFEVIKKRRSIRKFTATAVPEAIMLQAFQAAILAPNSSNAQTWNFYWIQNPKLKAQAVSACLGQSAARTAAELVVIVASPKDWKRSHQPLIKWVKDANAPGAVLKYYEFLPAVYRWGWLNSIGFARWIAFQTVGLFRPVMRRPTTRRDVQEVSIKSAALAAENFVLAISAQGFSTCMMEGIDEVRFRKLLKLRCSDRVVMAIGVGEAAERGTWGPQFRLPLDQVLHRLS